MTYDEGASDIDRKTVKNSVTSPFLTFVDNILFYFSDRGAYSGKRQGERFARGQTQSIDIRHRLKMGKWNARPIFSSHVDWTGQTICGQKHRDHQSAQPNGKKNRE